jgi:pyruvate-ferredoxin/flavodoxin oxidoreductase
VQEAQDMALIAHAATLEARVPFLHFFDGFRTSHEVNKIEQLTDDDLRAMIDDGPRAAHRAPRADARAAGAARHGPEPRRLLPGPRSRAIPSTTLPGHRPEAMDKFANSPAGYHLFEYVGAPTPSA